jgi:hypothetical protein
MSEEYLDNVELHDEDNQVEEGHDMKNAEAQSVASVDKASEPGKKAKARKGDNTKQDPMPKTKAGMINAMYTKMAGMKKEDLALAYSKMHEEFGEMEEDETIELPETSYDFSAELTDLVESESTLSDEFKSKTAVIFETAIRSKIAEEVDRLEDDYQSRLEEELESSRSDMVEKVDSYLNYVVETWMEENRVAVEQGLRTEIAENFMGKLKELFVESHIEVPESKVDLVDELAAQVDELEEKLNAQTSAAIAMQEKMEEYQRESVIRESARDLADTEVEKLRSLVSSLDFEDQESFAHKVKTVKESYFKKAVATESEEIAEDWSADVTETSSAMDLYLKSIKKMHKE